MNSSYSPPFWRALLLCYISKDEQCLQACSTSISSTVNLMEAIRWSEKVLLSRLWKALKVDVYIRPPYWLQVGFLTSVTHAQPHPFQFRSWSSAENFKSRAADLV